MFAAGDFRIHRFQINRRPVVLAVRGKWTFSDQQAAASIKKVIGIVRDFFHDDDFPYFLVTLQPFEQDHHNNDGTAFRHAIWLYMARLDPFSTQLTQISHEAFHAWNIRRMGKLAEAEDTIAWFHEGFTQYYAYLLLFRAGVLGLIKRVCERDVSER